MLKYIVFGLVIFLGVDADDCRPKDCPSSGVVLLSNPFDCSGFISCLNGRAIYRNCPDGELFDKTLHTCLQSNLARCDSCQDRREKIKKYVEYIPPQFLARFKALQEYDGPSANISQRCIENSVTPVICPSDIGDDRLMAHPDDCRLFYVCETIGQKPVCRDCPANLHFNPTLKVCDHSSNAGCMSYLVKPLPLPIEEKKTFQPIPDKFPRLTKEDFKAAYAKAVQRSADNTQCIQNNSPYADLRPDPEDCSKYYVCERGYLISMPCPGGLHFNTMFNVCDLPQNARCQQNSTEIYPRKTIALKEALKAVPNKMSEFQSGSNAAFERRIQPKADNTQCVQNNGPYADLRPDPEDCSKYYVCDSGYLISMPCPEGLHFSTMLKVCILPENARCQQNATTSYKHEITREQGFKPIPIKMPEPELGFNPIYGRAVQPKSGSQCVQNNGPNADLRPDPQDCSKYYVCDQGYLISMPCPDGLHFSTIFKICDLPQNARCQQNTTGTYKSEPKKLERVAQPKEVTIQCNSRQNGGWADLRPNPEDCSKYFVCDRGFLYSMNCPEGLHFSPASKVCDYPERVHCDVPAIWTRLSKENDDSGENDSSREMRNSEENSDSEENSHEYILSHPPHPNSRFYH